MIRERKLRVLTFGYALLIGVLFIGCQRLATLFPSSDISEKPEAQSQPAVVTATPTEIAQASRTTTPRVGASQPVLQEYPVPRGSRPHDVAPAPDGSVWYTAQGSVELGSPS
ncbi:MAG: putative hydrolase transrane protein [Dehalococcoidia bacterium]|nr:putative hydrolase transrane protein [Dehalococcoidia bacterium]